MRRALSRKEHFQAAVALSWACLVAALPRLLSAYVNLRYPAGGGGYPWLLLVVLGVLTPMAAFAAVWCYAAWLTDEGRDVVCSRPYGPSALERALQTPAQDMLLFLLFWPTHAAFFAVWLAQALWAHRLFLDARRDLSWWGGWRRIARNHDFVDWHDNALWELAHLRPIEGDAPRRSADFNIFEPLYEDMRVYSFPGTLYKHDWYYKLETMSRLYIKEDLIYTSAYRSAFWSGENNPFIMFGKGYAFDETYILDTRYWEAIRVRMVMEFVEVYYGYVETGYSYLDVILHYRRGIWATLNPRDLAAWTTPTAGAVALGHADFRQACALGGVRLDYAGWDPRASLLASFADPRSWFHTWTRLALDPSSPCAWRPDADVYTPCWLIVEHARRNPHVGSMMYPIRWDVGVYTDDPYLFTTVAAFIDVAVDACAVAGYPWHYASAG